MSERNWGAKFVVWINATAIVTILGMLAIGYLTGYNLGKDHADTEYSAGYHDNYAADRIDRECGGMDLATSKGHDCVEKQIQASVEHKTAYADLKSQERMAFWAILMGIFTGLTFFVTFAGVIFVAFTLDATRQTNAAAIDAAKAANDQVVQARYDSDTRLEPFFYFEDVQVLLTQNFRERSNVPWIKTVVRNISDGHALDVIMTVDWVAFDISDNTFSQVDVEGKVIDPRFGVDVPSSSKQYFGTRCGDGLDEKFVAAFKAGKVRLIFTLRFAYTNHRGKRDGFTRSFISDVLTSEYDKPVPMFRFSHEAKDARTSPDYLYAIKAAVPNNYTSSMTSKGNQFS